MTGTEYQKLAMGTAALVTGDSIDALSKTGLINAALGLTGEAGEFADLVKKLEHHGYPFDDQMREKLILEAGDLLWYTALAAERLGTNLDELMDKNLVKLKARYPNKFSSERSLNRQEYVAEKESALSKTESASEEKESVIPETGFADEQSLEAELLRINNAFGTSYSLEEVKEAERGDPNQTKTN